MKKSVTLFLCLLLALSMAVSVWAAGTVSVSADKSSVQQGGTVVITVSVDQLENCKSGGVKISFDDTVFERGSNEWLLTGTAIADANGNAVFAYSDPQTVSGGIYRFALTVKSGAPAKAYDVKITVTLKDASGGSSTVDKTVTISVACTHSYDNDCDATCNSCGEKRSVNHSWNSGEVTTQPTCTAEGVKTYTCSSCGATKTEAVSKTDHVWDGGKVTTEATCTAAGVKNYTCTGCGTTKTQEVEQLGHSWDRGKVTTEATCTSEGVKTYTCGNCGKTKTESIESLGHKYDNACDTACNRCGNERSITHDYKSSWTTDSASHWHACSVCGDKKDYADHIPGDEATEWTSQNCTICGYEIMAALGHTHTLDETLSSNEEGHWYACGGCDEQVEYGVHEFASECDTACDICGYVRDAEVEHEFSQEWASDENAHWHACALCGAMDGAAEHIPGDIATDTTDQTCTECGYVIAVAGSHEHSFGGEWISDESGHWQACICGEQSVAQSHVWDETVVDEQTQIIYALCLECGYQVEVGHVEPTESTNDPTQATKPNQSAGNAVDIALLLLKIVPVVLLLIGLIYVIVGISKSKKQVGKFSPKEKSDAQVAAEKAGGEDEEPVQEETVEESDQEDLSEEEPAIIEEPIEE